MSLWAVGQIGSKDYVGFDIVIIFYTLKEILVTEMYVLISNRQIIHEICVFTLYEIYLTKRSINIELYLMIHTVST